MYLFNKNRQYNRMILPLELAEYMLISDDYMPKSVCGYGP